MLTKKITALLFGLLALNANTLFAQDSLLLRDYRFVQQSSPWLTQRNAAALTLFNSQNIAEAELSFTHASGKLTNFSGSPSLNDFQAATESYYRINPRTVVYGAIGYDNLSGKDMTGSVFMQDRLPFDIVEDSLTNMGRKHRDTYHLVGAFGYTVANGFAVGMKADYTAANYAKYKDLRHKNKLMNLDFTAGVLGSFKIQGSSVNVGLDYTYHRRTESVEFGTYGKGDKVYKSLIDYGALMGIVEQFGNDGYTDKTNEMPLFEDAHGVGLQLEFLPIFLSASYSHATGYYGRQSQYTITYTDHNRDIFTLQGRLSHAFSASRFSLDVKYQSEKSRIAHLDHHSRLPLATARHHRLPLPLLSSATVEHQRGNSQSDAPSGFHGWHSWHNAEWWLSDRFWRPLPRWLFRNTQRQTASACHNGDLPLSRL